jgi:hypothetical protein
LVLKMQNPESLLLEMKNLEIELYWFCISNANSFFSLWNQTRFRTKDSARVPKERSKKGFLTLRNLF